MVLTSKFPPIHRLMMMESRKLAGILSSLISQLLLLLIHNIFPPNNINNNSILTLLLLSHQQVAAASVSLSPNQPKRKRKRKRKRDSPSNPLSLTPDPFRNTFLMSSSSFEWLSGLLEPLLECRDPAPLFGSLRLSSGTRLAIGLSRLAEGLDYPQISSRFSVPIPVARFCVKQLCRVLCTNFRFWVSLPPPSDLPSISLSFHSLSSLPNCCGALLTTRFNLLNSSSSLAAQLLVDSSSRILTIAAGFPGHKSDFEILSSSSLYDDIHNGTLLNVPLNQYLIADSNYPLLPWLMVPYSTPVPSSAQDNFNSAHRIMRLPSLRAAASLRNWGVLSRPLDDDLKMAVAYIGACSILHNSLLMREDFSALASQLDDSHSKHTFNSYNSHAFQAQPLSSEALTLRDNLAALTNRVPHSNNS